MSVFFQNFNFFSQGKMRKPKSCEHVCNTCELIPLGNFYRLVPLQSELGSSV